MFTKVCIFFNKIEIEHTLKKLHLLTCCFVQEFNYLEICLNSSVFLGGTDTDLLNYVILC